MSDTQNTDFDLIETILWEDGRYFLPELHIERLSKSAAYFSFRFDVPVIENELEKAATSMDVSSRYRVRLLLKKDGNVSTETYVLDNPDLSPLKITISRERTDTNDIFLYHKTTNRKLYDTELDKYRSEGFFDVLFLNEKEEITEGAITNIVIRKNGDYLTPPVPCGLLPGVYRKYLLQTDDIRLEEKVLYLEDLVSADEILLINSVRKMVHVVLSDQ